MALVLLLSRSHLEALSLWSHRWLFLLLSPSMTNVPHALAAKLQPADIWLSNSRVYIRGIGVVKKHL